MLSISNKTLLNNKDILTLREIFEDNFVEWIRFADDIINNDPSTGLIRKNAPDYDAAQVRQLVSAEFDKYKANPECYIYEVLSQGQKHCLFAIPAYVQNSKIQNREAVVQIKEMMTPLFKRIQSMDTKLNLRNCRGLLRGPMCKFGEMLKKPSKASCKEFLKSGYLVANELRDLDLFQRINEDCDWFKNAPSGRAHIDHYIDWAKNHKNDGV